MKHNQPVQVKEKNSSKTIWQVVGGAALLVVVAGVIVSLPDLVRYIKITRM